MTLYVIMRTDGMFFAIPGERSYTKDLTKARTWRKRENAERHLCPENERIVPVLELLQPPCD